MAKIFTYKDYTYSRLAGKNNFTGSSAIKVKSDSHPERIYTVYSSDENSFHDSCKRVIDSLRKSGAYDLHSDFDIEKHKQTYINYLEVIIMPTGKVSYAVPSHVAKLESIACHQLGIDRDELLSSCPRDRWLDYNDWLMEITNCIMVWTDFYLGEANEYQLAKLEEMKEAGIYSGSLSPGFSNKNFY